MKGSAITRIVLFSIAILLLIGLLLTGLFAGKILSIPFLGGVFNRVTSDHTSQGGASASSGAVRADAVRNLQIDWVSGSITIQPGDTDAITFSEPEDLPEDQKMVWKQSGDTLRIQFCQSSKDWSFGFSFNSDVPYSKDLVVTVPADWICNKLDIHSVSASLDVTGITAQKIDLENVSGECGFRACSAQEADLDTVSGGLSFEGSLQELDFSSVSADCTAVLSNVPKEVELDGVSGSLNLTLPEDAGFTAKLSSASGEISTDFPTTVSKGKYLCGDGSCQINADTVSGDVWIHKAK